MLEYNKSPCPLAVTDLFPLTLKQPIVAQLLKRFFKHALVSRQKIHIATGLELTVTTYRASFQEVQNLSFNISSGGGIETEINGSRIKNNVYSNLTKRQSDNNT